MRTAIKLAKKHKSTIALIDQDITITLKKLSKNITAKEKFTFVIDLIKGLFFKKHRIKIDLTKVPKKKIIKKMISKVKKSYPNVYKTLIKERNLILAKNLKKLMQDKDKKIIAIIGAGHEDEVLRLIKK